MNTRYENLRVRMNTPRDGLRGSLSDEDEGNLTSLIDANEFGVALELIVDSLIETRKAVPRAAAKLIEELAQEMEMLPALLERVPQSWFESGEKGH